jgi:hypothetical protein
MPALPGLGSFSFVFKRKLAGACQLRFKFRRRRVGRKRSEFFQRGQAASGPYESSQVAGMRPPRCRDPMPGYSTFCLLAEAMIDNSSVFKYFSDSLNRAIFLPCCKAVVAGTVSITTITTDNPPLFLTQFFPEIDRELSVRRTFWCNSNTEIRKPGAEASCARIMFLPRIPIGTGDRESPREHE